MKKTFLTVFASALFTFSYAQTVHEDHQHDNATTATIVADDVLKLKETAHDFSQIPQGKPVYYSFEITNVGKTELKLDNVQASCGCTTPEWSRDPIAAGATAQIRVGYNAAAQGPFEKTITITPPSYLSRPSIQSMLEPDSLPVVYFNRTVPYFNENLLFRRACGGV